MSIDLDAVIRRVPNHPKPGILFYDVSPVFEDRRALGHCVTRLSEHARHCATELVLGIEARGFVLAAAIANELGVGMVMARKPGRLPGATIGREYDLEYGTDRLETHVGAIPPGSRVLVHDDLLATGGTALAACGLVEDSGATVASTAFVVELDFLPGRAALHGAGHAVQSLVRFSSEGMD